MREWEFLQQEEHILNWLASAKTENEAFAAANLLHNLRQAHLKQLAVGIPFSTEKNPCKEVPLTAQEKFDKGNSRREAILAQRARRG
jgi:hypothetical protein